MSLRSVTALASNLQLPNLSKPFRPASEIRGELLNQFLDCVQQCQVRYGGKTELASEKDTQVSELCASLEAVLSHGLRVSPLISTLRSGSPAAATATTLKNVSKLISGRLHLNDDKQVFWHYVLLFLTPHERERYAVLRNITSDIGRGRAWIRGSLNERSLERYFHYMLEDNELLQVHYEDWALMRDVDTSAMFPNMVAGLNSILFAISIDNKTLNSTNVETTSLITNMKNEPIIITKIPSADTQSASSGSSVEGRRQHRKVAKHIITFDDDDDSDKKIDSTNFVNKRRVVDGTVEIAANQVFKNIEDNLKPNNEVNENRIFRTISDENCNINDKLLPIESNYTVITNESSENSETKSENVSLSEHEDDCRSEVATNDINPEIEALKRENETLKSQLKKYIGAVQMLDRTESENNLPQHQELAKHYEAKLIQVAEMHAELMEFNEYLQHQINFKDAVINRLKKQLSQNTNYEQSVHTRGEVFVSIPSAFLSGDGPKQHHVYQIHIRAGNHEWNIFRRYAHFHALHSQLKKLDSKVSDFKFPPKKTIGNKDKKLVEKRRKMLEAYLRKLFSHWPELGACSSRAAVEQYLAFFREPQNCSPVPSSPETHYNGL